MVFDLILVDLGRKILDFSNAKNKYKSLCEKQEKEHFKNLPGNMQPQKQNLGI